MKVTTQKIYDFKEHPMTKVLMEYLKDRITDYERLGKSVVNQVVVIDDKVKAELNAMAGRLHILKAITEGIVFDDILAESQAAEEEADKKIIEGVTE